MYAKVHELYEQTRPPKMSKPPKIGGKRYYSESEDGPDGSHDTSLLSPEQIAESSLMQMESIPHAVVKVIKEKPGKKSKNARNSGIVPNSENYQEKVQEEKQLYK